MRRCCNAACCASKYDKVHKYALFSESLGYATDVQDTLCHLNDLNALSNKTKAILDIQLDEISCSLTKLSNSLAKEINARNRCVGDTLPTESYLAKRSDNCNESNEDDTM